MSMIKQVNIRQLHKAVAPLMCVPLLLTLLTGILFQIAAISGNETQFLWLIEIHRGKFGRFNLELIYPFLNALGLFILVITGILMWLRQRLPRKKRTKN